MKWIWRKFREIDDNCKMNLFSAKFVFYFLSKWHRFHGKIEKLQKFREYAVKCNFNFTENLQDWLDFNVRVSISRKTLRYDSLSRKIAINWFNDFSPFFQMIVVIRQAVIVKTAPVWTVSAIVTMGMEAKAAICLMTMSANIGRVTYLGKYRLQWLKYKHVLF